MREKRKNQKGAGRQIKLETILKHLETQHSEGEEDQERLTVEHFMKIVPGLPQEQATRILLAAYVH